MKESRLNDLALIALHPIQGCLSSLLRKSLKCLCKQMFYGEQNKSRWGGGQKIKKGIIIFSKEGFLMGGHNVAKGGTQKRANCAPPLKKCPRKPLGMPPLQRLATPR